MSFKDKKASVLERFTLTLAFYINLKCYNESIFLQGPLSLSSHRSATSALLLQIRL